MKKTTLFAVILGLFSTVTFAKHGGEKGPCSRLDKMRLTMKDSLQLSSEQDLKIKAINDSACANFQAAATKANGNKEALKESRKAIMKNTLAAYKTVLTPAQLTKYKAMHKGKKHAEWDAEKRAEKMTEKMNQELTLTADQLTKVKAANLELVNRMHGLKEKKEAGTDSVELKEMHKLIHKEYKEKLSRILTKEQMEKMKSLKKEKVEMRKAKNKK